MVDFILIFIDFPLGEEADFLLSVHNFSQINVVFLVKNGHS